MNMIKQTVPPKWPAACRILFGKVAIVVLAALLAACQMGGPVTPDKSDLNVEPTNVKAGISYGPPKTFFENNGQKKII